MGDRIPVSEIFKEMEKRIAELEAERDKLRGALQLIFDLPKERPSLDGSDWYDEAQVIAKHALADTQKLDDHPRMAFGEDA